MKETKDKKRLEIDDLDSPVIIRNYEKAYVPGDSVWDRPNVDILPTITIMKTIAGTKYSVTGAYTGDSRLEDKISQILKRDMEV